jgi:hypothetical protein
MTINGYLYAHCEETFEKYWINLFDVDYDLGRAQYSVDDEQLFDIRITSLEFTHAQKWKLFLNGQIDKNNDAYWHTWELEFNKDYSGASLIHRIVIPAYRSAAHRTQHIRTDIIEVIITK